MGIAGEIASGILGRIADLTGQTIQADRTTPQVYRDYDNSGYSVETDVSETIADLVLMLSSMPISGTSERAKWLDSIADEFFWNGIYRTVVAGYLTGDCIVVPSWNGRNMQNVVVDSDDFIIMDAQGDEITSCAYVIDEATVKSRDYKLCQAIDLVGYTAPDGTKTYANRYRMFIAHGDTIVNMALSEVPKWANYEKEWYIPNVDRLLIGRFKSFTVNPNNLNSMKGAPICYKASDAIREIHYLLEQMHVEFGLSEKMVMMNREVLKNTWKNGRLIAEVPQGRERLIVPFTSPTDDGGNLIHDWSPDIRYQPYLDALDKQERRVEHSVGVSSGIISTANDINYQNVDNVRKSQQKTMSFVSRSRKVAEDMLENLVYAWNVIANYYNIVPMGDYEVSYDWSDDYIETFSDRMNAIIAGYNIGATDAVDYRMAVMGESPEAAREKVEQIQEEKLKNRDMFFNEPTEEPTNEGEE